MKGECKNMVNNGTCYWMIDIDSTTFKLRDLTFYYQYEMCTICNIREVYFKSIIIEIENEPDLTLIFLN